jgi:DNA-binding FadR family transcriptional regulator
MKPSHRRLKSTFLNPIYDAHRSLIDAIESRAPDIAGKAVRDFMNFILVALPEVSRS